ncbi:MAG TPA: FxsA family protein [Marmoricola sp.]|nr:FxsA family protein [Marmoricola sp.]
MRRRVPWGVLAVLFVVVPIVEIYLIVQLGQAVGPWWTILLLIGAGVLGSVLVKREGGRAWRALQDALASHRMPATELADGALILIGGTLLLTPGFLSDVVGLFCILPFTRPVARRALARLVRRRLLAASPTAPGHPRTARRPGHTEVIRGEVVDDDE